MSPMPLGILALAGAGGKPFWFAQISQAGGMIHETSTGYAIGIAGNNSLYTTDEFGNVTATKTYVTSSTRQLLVDELDNIYLADSVNSRAQVTKIDSSFNTVWAHYQNNSLFSYDVAYPPKFVHNEIYLPYGYGSGGNDTYAKVFKIAKDGSNRRETSWAAFIDFQADPNHCRSVAPRADSGTWSGASYGVVFGTSRGYIAHFDANNNVVRHDFVALNNESVGEITYDPSIGSEPNLVYASNTNFIFKRTSLANANQFTARFSGINGSARICVDGAGNTYYANRSSANDGTIYVIKLDSGLNIVWQRSLSNGTTNAGNVFNIRTFDDKIVIGASAGSDSIFGVLPTDGSGSGSYNFGGSTWTYAASALTRSTQNTGNNGDSTYGLSSATVATTAFTPSSSNSTSLLTTEALA